MNFVWIVLDTQRGDHLGCYDYWRDVSPNMDALAREGVRFKDFYASAIATGPGFTSLVTGRFPATHGFYLTPWNIPNAINFDDDIPVAAEMFLDSKRYTTVAFDNLINFRSHMKQFVRGYEWHINVTGTSKWEHHLITADMLNARLLPWLDHYGVDEQPFFMFVHYWDPHLPYNHPDAFRNKFKHEPGNLGDLKVVKTNAGYDFVPGWGKADEIFEGEPNRSIDLYDEEVLYVDHAIGEIVEKLDKLGILDGTCLVITSDHGESLGQHGIYGHGLLDDATIFLPCIMRYPKGLPQGKVVEGFAQQTDILPTLLEMAGIDAPPMDGRSLLKQIRGEEPGAEIMFSETGYHRAIQIGEWKLIRGREGEKELYNLKDDPAEVINLAEDDKPRALDMELRLLEYVEELVGEDGRDPQPDAKGPWTCYFGDDLKKD